MTSISYNRIRRLDLGAQLLHLRTLRLPGATGQLRNGLLTFEYVVRPTPLSRDYSLRLTYRRGDPPQVRVLSPSVPDLADGHGPVPHLYEDVDKRQQQILIRARSFKYLQALVSSGEEI